CSTTEPAHCPSTRWGSSPLRPPHPLHPLATDSTRPQCCKLHGKPPVRRSAPRTVARATKTLPLKTRIMAGYLPASRYSQMEIKVNFLDNLRLEAKFDDFTVIADQP